MSPGNTHHVVTKHVWTSSSSVGSCRTSSQHTHLCLQDERVDAVVLLNSEDVGVNQEQRLVNSGSTADLQHVIMFPLVPAVRRPLVAGSTNVSVPDSPLVESWPGAASSVCSCEAPGQ